MGNKDGFVTSLTERGKNRVIEFDGGFFSFAFGDEIALCLPNVRINPFWILNCDEKLWEEVKNECIKTKYDKKELINFWLKKSKKYPISDWSGDFEKLKEFRK